jgi:hypothetical protein
LGRIGYMLLGIMSVRIWNLTVVAVVGLGLLLSWQVSAGASQPKSKSRAADEGVRPTSSSTSSPSTSGQQAGKPEDTEVWQPVPKMVTSGANNAAPPSDAIVLFDGTSLSEWVSAQDKSPAKWTVSGGVLTVNKAEGNIETKRTFKNYQLHLEWKVPENITGSGQLRGNSGLFLASTGPADAGYELQILDSYQNPTYVNGQAASIYKQAAPLVNPNRKPGEWQTYDVVWTAPVFNGDGSVKTPAYVTVFFNGVLVQNHFELKGETRYIGQPFYKKFDGAPIKLQAHGDPSPPISFRNIWIRELE